MLLLNIVGTLALFIALGEGASFGLAILYFVLFTPFSYICWFRPVYKAFRNDSSVNFMVFFLCFFFQLVFSIIFAAGFPQGSCGWVSAISAFSGGRIGLGIFLLVLSLAETVLAATVGYAFFWVHRVYRSTGASFAKAQLEFSQGVIRNEHVQNVAANAASTAVQSQLASATAGGATSPRF